MKRMVIAFLLGVVVAVYALRTDASPRAADTVVRGQTEQRGDASARAGDTTVVSRSAVQQRAATGQPAVAARSAAVPRATGPAVAARSAAPASARATVPSRAVARSAATPQAARSAVPQTTARSATVARSAAAVPETRIGAAYERCRDAYFACMDQFCSMKNPSHGRCSCSNQIFDIIAAQDVLVDAATRLNQFNEDLDAVGMTAHQAAAMRRATEGELALMDDTTGSRGLLDAIMASIRGDDATVGGRHDILNPIIIHTDMSMAFGASDAQLIAQHNGQNLYNAVIGRCRQLVRDMCTDAQLQRAVTAYLMAITNDCNALQRRMEDTQRELLVNVRESDAMLALARVQNQKNLNALDATECFRQVEAAIMSPEVCGPGYRRCLDNGQFIDINTGRPFEGVANFYELGELLSFATEAGISGQRISQNPANRIFVQDFVSRVKPFAEPVLSRCTNIRTQIWDDFLDRAILEIHFAQVAKVNEIRSGCMDFISACYMGAERSLTASMRSITGDVLTNQPGSLMATDAMCRHYVNACDTMFGRVNNGIIAQFVENRRDEDLHTACRAIVTNCFNRFGGTNLSNFFNPQSGIFHTGRALDWFSFYAYRWDPGENEWVRTDRVVSECARELLAVESCNPPDNPNFARGVFGGFDVAEGSLEGVDRHRYNYMGPLAQRRFPLGVMLEGGLHISPTGVATEMYYRIVNTLSVLCENHVGTFAENRDLLIRLPQEGYPINEDPLSKNNLMHNWANTCQASTGDNSILNATGNPNFPHQACVQAMNNSAVDTSWGICGATICPAGSHRSAGRCPTGLNGDPMCLNAACRCDVGLEAIEGSCLRACPADISEPVTDIGTDICDANDARCMSSPDFGNRCRCIGNRIYSGGSCQLPIIPVNAEFDYRCIAHNSTDVHGGDNRCISRGVRCVPNVNTVSVNRHGTFPNATCQIAPIPFGGSCPVPGRHCAAPNVCLAPISGGGGNVCRPCRQGHGCPNSGCSVGAWDECGVACPSFPCAAHQICDNVGHGSCFTPQCPSCPTGCWITGSPIHGTCGCQCHHIVDPICPPGDMWCRDDGIIDRELEHGFR
ncbi:MAG: hypothetical protein FWC83_00605 [Alphaproteobacteria bacterium]|nr:hypothetical protein [Alphaproteobacteria bacterium]